MYVACVLSALLYSTEAWPALRSHITLLERFHQQCLRRILNVKWQTFTPDTKILELSKLDSIEAFVMQMNLRWSGHVSRMDDSRIPKGLLYGELAIEKRKRGGERPDLRTA